MRYGTARANKELHFALPLDKQTFKTQHNLCVVFKILQLQERQP